jgi:hypothetical protein
MADGVNRVVPPSVSLDPTSVLGRERERGKKGNERKKAAEQRSEPLAPQSPTALDDELTDLEQDKGKNLDIKA